ncbi:MAG: response regulator [Deltaproteobacteria bacterium]|nr:response regulator [Deltaproteobacteria bacterium]MCX7952201.1 response regulator [Deltaproteobacteria bacterium]
MAYNVLLVDDSSLARKVLRRALIQSSVSIGQVYEAENGKQALEILDNQWVDCVFLDINMPVMTGIEFVEEARKKDELRDLKIIVVSTEGSEERLAYLKKLGVLEIVRKPIAPEKLKTVFEKIF